MAPLRTISGTNGSPPSYQEKALNHFSPEGRWDYIQDGPIPARGATKMLDLIEATDQAEIHFTLQQSRRENVAMSSMREIKLTSLWILRHRHVLRTAMSETRLAYSPTWMYASFCCADSRRRRIRDRCCCA